VTAHGVCWNTSPNPTTANSFTTDGTGTGTFVSALTGLTEDTTYYVRAYATNAVGTYYGNEVSFTTPVWECGNPIMDERDGQTYNTIQIGEQCWMAENLNVGIRIDGSSNQTNNGTIEKYCYDNLVGNCDVYGGLYQWDEMMGYLTQEGVQGICPENWHLPTDAEWTVLTNFLGGEGVVGGKLKETGTTHWQSPNTGATNSSGFTGLPGGRYVGGSYIVLGSYGHWWSSTDYSSYAWRRDMYYINGEVGRGDSNQSSGFSVRCVRD